MIIDLFFISAIHHLVVLKISQSRLSSLCWWNLRVSLGSVLHTGSSLVRIKLSLWSFSLTHNEVKSDGLCSFSQDDSLHHHCIYICKANLHKPIWINLVSKTFRDPSALLKNPQALDILSLLLTLYVLPYSVVIHLGEVCSLKSTINFWFPQAQMEQEWKPGPREFLFAWIMLFCNRISSLMECIFYIAWIYLLQVCNTYWSWT